MLEYNIGHVSLLGETVAKRKKKDKSEVAMPEVVSAETEPAVPVVITVELVVTSEPETVSAELVPAATSEPVSDLVATSEPAVPVVASDLFGEPVSMPRDVLTASQLAKMAHVDGSRIRQLADRGRFPGAFQLAGRWFIPADAAAVWLSVDRDRRRKETKAGGGV